MNCLDCLDRTNAVQSFIALEVCPAAALGPPVSHPRPSVGQAGLSTVIGKMRVASLG